MNNEATNCDCNCDCGNSMEKMPNITINIKYVDNRLNKDKSTYVDTVIMEETDVEGD